MANAKPKTKSEIFSFIAEQTDLKRKDVSSVFDALASLIEKELNQGPGVVNIPGMMKIKVVRKEAVPERQGVNPFTGEQTTFKAKPARNVVKVTPLKALKDMV